MPSLLPYLTSIALLDSISMLTTAVVPLLVLLSGPRPLLKSLSFVFGVWFSYVGCGLLVLLGADAILDPLAPTIRRIMQDPNTLEILIQILLGLILLVFGVKLADTRARRQRRRTVKEGSGTVGVFGLGAVFTLSGIWGALPYFAALDRILRADVPDMTGLMLVLFYNLVFVLPLIALIVIRVTMGPRADAWFTAIRQWFARWGRRLGVAVLTLLGMLLVADGIGWLLGRNLLPIGL